MKVISRRQIPARSPFLLTSVACLCMDRLAVSGAWLGVCWTVLTLIWIGFVCVVIKEDEVNVKL